MKLIFYTGIKWSTSKRRSQETYEVRLETKDFERAKKNDATNVLCRNRSKAKTTVMKGSRIKLKLTKLGKQV